MGTKLMSILSRLLLVSERIMDKCRIAQPSVTQFKLTNFHILWDAIKFAKLSSNEIIISWMSKTCYMSTVIVKIKYPKAKLWTTIDETSGINYIIKRTDYS